MKKAAYLTCCSNNAMVRVEVRHDNMADDSPYAEALKWPGFTQGYNFPCETHFIVHLTLLFFCGERFC